MRRLTLALMLFAVPLPALAQHRDDDDSRDRPAVVDRGDVAEQLSNIDALISDAMGRIRGKSAALKALRRAREELDAVRDQVNGAPSPREWLREQREPNRWSDRAAAEPPRHAPPPPAEPAIQPISDAALAQLISAIDQQPSSAGRLRVLQQAAPANYFLVRQVQMLLGRFTFAPDQLQAALLLQPRVLDRENEHQLNRWLQAPAQANPHAGLVERTSFEARASVRLQPGVYRGNFTLAGSSLTVEGAGRDQTIIDGNLIINGTFSTVKSLTVLGKIVIQGSQNQVKDVDYRAGIEDRGLLNKY